MENRTIKDQFYMYPGVFQLDGKKHSAFINLMTGEIKVVDKQPIDDNISIEAMKALEAGNIGVILPRSHPLFLSPGNPFTFEIDFALKVLICDHIEWIRYLDMPINQILFFSSEEPIESIEKNRIFAEAKKWGHYGMVTFYKFDPAVCPFDYFNKKPKINPFFYFHNSKYNPCWGLSIAIDRDGNVKPCLWYPEIIGNLRSDPFSVIKSRLVFFWELTKDKINGCMECALRYTCSDCRVAAKKIGGNIYSKTSLCSWNPDEEK